MNGKKLLLIFLLTPLVMLYAPRVETSASLNSSQPEPPKTAKPVEPAPETKTAAVAPVEPPKRIEPEPVAVAQSPSAGSNGHIVSCENFRPVLAKYGWNVNVALKVIDAESYGGVDGMCNTMAKNPEYHRSGGCYGSFGLFQISCHGGEIYDVEANVAAAWAKYQARGWSPWGVCNRGIVSCY